MTDQGSDPDRPVVVLAARHRTFECWCRERRINPRTAIWVGNTEDAAFRVRGHNGPAVHLASDWEEVPRLAEVVALLHSREAVLPPELTISLKVPDAAEGWVPGRWYRILKADGSLWMETSDRAEVMDEWGSRPTNSGWVLQQLWVLHRERWGDVAMEEL